MISILNKPTNTPNELSSQAVTPHVNLDKSWLNGLITLSHMTKQYLLSFATFFILRVWSSQKNPNYNPVIVANIMINS